MTDDGFGGRKGGVRGRSEGQRLMCLFLEGRSQASKRCVQQDLSEIANALSV